MRFADYQAKGFLELPLMHDRPHVCPRQDGRYHYCRICQDIKRPYPKYGDWEGWTEEKWFWKRIQFIKKFGAPPGLGSLTGERTGIDGYHIMAVDHDHIRPGFKGRDGGMAAHIKFYRDRKTWINLTPNGGWHDIFLVPRRYMTSELERAGILCGGDLLPRHDVLWWVPAALRTRGEKIKGGGPAYFAHEPTTINGRPYFWLDEKKMNHGELEIRRLDL